MRDESISTAAGVVLKPRGIARFFPAAFLAFWLCGWFMGEVFALAAALGCLHELFGTPVPSWLPPIHTGRGGAIPVLAFITFWLTFWTIGGFGAMAALAGLLWGSEEVTWDDQQIEVASRAFPFAMRRRIAWADVWRIENTKLGLTALTRRGRKSITTMGTYDERMMLAQQLGSRVAGAESPLLVPSAARPGLAAGTSRGALVAQIAGLLGQRAMFAPAVTGASPVGDELPPGWLAEPDESGQLALVEKPEGRRAIAGFLFVFGSVLAFVGWNIAKHAPPSGWSAKQWIGVLVTGSIALLTGGFGLYLAGTRHSLHVRGNGVVDRTQGFGRTIERTWTPAKLELQSVRDSDGDESWRLVVSAPGSSPGLLASAVNDPSTAIALGRWLSARAGVPFEDASRDSRSSAA